MSQPNQPSQQPPSPVSACVICAAPIWSFERGLCYQHIPLRALRIVVEGGAYTDFPRAQLSHIPMQTQVRWLLPYLSASWQSWLYAVEQASQAYWRARQDSENNGNDGRAA